MKRLLILFVVFTLVFALKSEAKPISFSIKINYGSPDGKGGCIQEFGICSIIISWRTAGGSADSNSETMVVKGEIHNNMLVINLPKGINENGINKQGGYNFTLQKEMILEPGLAKELGVEKLVIAPGNYEFKGNTLSLKIVSPRETGSGLPTGQRLLPTVNKKDIAIDEPGVQKSSAPRDAASGQATGKR